jgi:hypothetical protein
MWLVHSPRVVKLLPVEFPKNTAWCLLMLQSRVTVSKDHTSMSAEINKNSSWTTSAYTLRLHNTTVDCTMRFWQFPMCIEFTSPLEKVSVGTAQELKLTFHICMCLYASDDNGNEKRMLASVRRLHGSRYIFNYIRKLEYNYTINESFKIYKFSTKIG